MGGLAADPLDPAVVRLRDGPHVLGAGFLIAPEVIATCAHVLEGASEPVADFPLLGSADHPVEVLEQNGELDVAILRLTDPPPGALPVPARITGAVRDHRFRTFGFPHDLPDGIWVTGRLLGAQGAGRIQMAVDPDHWRIEPGFSGAPVWDEELAGVVGMVVTTTARSGTTAHLVPTTALGDAWTAPARNPYRGLRPFREEDAELFHGRDADIAHLFQLAARQDIVAVAGPSGSGKSSLVRAGLLPRLKQAGADVVDLGLTDDIPTTPGTVLVLDQFEEAVIANPAAAREKLAAVGRAVAAQPRRPGEPAPLRAVLTLRSRSLDDLISRETVAELNRAVWFLEPMSREQLAAAIEEPAASVGGLAFESGLVQRILDDTADEPSTLPLVSLVLDQLWQHRHGGWLTHEAYERMGRVPGALRNAADEALRSLKPRQREGARRLLTRLTRHDGEGGYARRSAQLTDLEPELRETAHDLAAKRLLVVHEQRVNLTHQALIDQWPTLREWLTEDADFLAWQAKLIDLHDSGGLLRDVPLAEAEAWLHQRPQDIPDVQRQFIRRSTATQRRDRTRWRTITAVSVTLMLVAAVLAGVAIESNGDLHAQIRMINAADLSEASDNATEANPSEALQFALAAWREEPESVEALGALLQQRLYWRGVDRVLTEPPLRGVGEMLASANGQVVVFVPENPADQVVVWWDLLTANTSHRLIPTSEGARFALTQDGRRLAQYLPDEGVLLWDLTSVGEPMVLHPPLESSLDKISFSANGRFLALAPYAAPARTVLLWDLRDIRSIPEPAEYEYGGITSFDALYPSPDGRSLVVIQSSGTTDSGASGHTAFARDLATGSEIRRSEQTESSDIELLDGGLQVATCTASGLDIRDSFTGALTYTRTGDCNLFLDASRQFLLFNDNPNGVGISTAVQWRTGAEANLSESVAPRSWDGTIPPLLVPNQDGSLSSISVRNGAVQVSSIPGGERAEVQRVRNDLMAQSPDGKFWAAYGYAPSGLAEDQGEIVLLDSRGVAVRRTNAPAYPQAVAFDSTGERVLVVVGARMFIYRTDDLMLERDVVLPVPLERRADEESSGDASVRAVPGGPVLVSNLGMLSSWDIRTGVQTRPALPTVAPVAWLALTGGPQIELRPRHPEQVVSQSDSGLSVWDLHTGKRLSTYSVPGSQFVVSTDGAVAAVADEDRGSIAVVDLGSERVLRSLPAQTSQLIGISGTYLFAEEGMGADIQIWDWDKNRKMATAELDTNYEAQTVEGNAYLPDRRPGYHERIPLDPETWFRDLCRISDRGFTPQELASLPAGVSTEPPCR
ncbi:nSTAND1 domain-containing NTPase [Saccharopolyspora sp. 5N708]|uniref:nSTAND1 domain-containing NTPase n=1 Tax=Saccharopolyspora sp. 5N708 TaxID=3457424 RepID=UPI003FD6054B